VPPCPIVIWQITLKSTLRAQELLVGIYEVPMPCEEVGLPKSILVVRKKIDGMYCSMDRVCLQHVRHDEVIVSTFGPRCDCRWGQSRLAVNAFDGIDIIQLLWRGELRPPGVQSSSQCQYEARTILFVPGQCRAYMYPASGSHVQLHL
jgi:hypothetical protein